MKKVFETETVENQIKRELEQGFQTRIKRRSFTSVFTVQLQQKPTLKDYPVELSGRDDVVWSEICDPGWRCGISIDDLGACGVCRIHFDPSMVDPALGSITLSIVVKASDTEDFDGILLKDVVVDHYIGLPSRELEQTWVYANQRCLHGGLLSIVFTTSYLLPSCGTNPSDLTSAFRQTLETSMSNGAFIDTKFFAFSRRQGSGRVDRPLPIFANSSILEVFSSHIFSEWVLAGLDEEFPPSQEPYVEEYDYDSDSDLVSESLDDEEEMWSPVYQTESRRLSEAGLYTQPLNLSGKSDTVTVESGSSMNSCRRDDIKILSGTERSRGENLGRMIIVKDAAYATYRALIFYLYTGDVAFSPLKSELGMHSTPAPVTGNHPPPPCSPKSMYRLADKLGLKELKERAFEAIRSSISENNILEEAFSKLTSTHSQIRDMEVDMLCKKLNSPEMMAAFRQTMMQRTSDGRILHSMELISSVFEKLAVNTSNSRVSGSQ